LLLSMTTNVSHDYHHQGQAHNCQYCVTKEVTYTLYLKSS
jgi:hypothetical protein